MLRPRSRRSTQQMTSSITMTPTSFQLKGEGLIPGGSGVFSSMQCASQLRGEGFSASDLWVHGFDAKKLLDEGCDVWELKNAGCGVRKLKDAGITASELREQDFDAEQFKDAGFVRGSSRTQVSMLVS